MRNANGQVVEESTRNGVATSSDRNAATGWLLGSASIAYADTPTQIQGWSYRFDESGNLRRRTRSDQVNTADSNEVFTYDRLDRLKSSHVTVGGQSANESYGYDSIGNLTQKGSKGYGYNAGCTTPSGRPIGPHAVCTVTGSNPFTYDDNGNIISGNGRTVTYNSVNKPVSIESAPAVSQGNDTGRATFVYGADDNRVVQTTGPSAGGSEARTVYVGMDGTGKSTYERTTRGGSTVEHVQFTTPGDRA